MNEISRFQHSSYKTIEILFSTRSLYNSEIFCFLESVRGVCCIKQVRTLAGGIIKPWHKAESREAHHDPEQPQAPPNCTSFSPSLCLSSPLLTYPDTYKHGRLPPCSELCQGTAKGQVSWKPYRNKKQWAALHGWFPLPKWKCLHLSWHNVYWGFFYFFSLFTIRKQLL